ncbi:SDR family NAD(P)-dependent oxidoreductase [Mycobacterium sp. C3-094]|uniref:SDR family NAD(P)-dependent oxidoreductase n=1 Tax=Mycobacterium sp. PSTR-4-N TaxID=2917745 RepID=UPI001F14FCE3|nr:SDR family NAD(P)-dependent oxidoreductase [Mycobacterium sp. PSTR-4-N]MCG7597662.1 SDR family NAD(P)-dependent oxidoreductase [Mycobacterium sp. PSTR-4-N]
MTAPLALVTGASSGIGLELARRFARDGYDLVVAAEDDGIVAVPDQLATYGGAVHPVQVDLRTPEGVEHLFASTVQKGTPVAAAALNAGVGRGDMFLASELADDMSIIDLNVRSTVHLAKLVLRDMANRDAGRVLFTSSVASMMPGSFQPVYNASKSFVQSFVKALQDELRDTSITVTALLPGPTDTAFFGRAKMLHTPIGRMGKDDPAEVARQGYEALMRGDRQVVAASWSSKMMGSMLRVLPDPIKAAGNRLVSAPFGR